MPYLNIDMDFLEHPQTLRLVGLLGRGAEVLPIRLWSYCGKFHAEKGLLTGHTEQEIEALLRWWGKPGEAVPAMVKAEYLVKEGEWYGAAHWEKHNGHIWALKVRSQKANDERWRQLREEKAAKAAILHGTPQGVLKDNLGSPPSVRPTKKNTDSPSAIQKQKCSVKGCGGIAELNHTECPPCEQGVPL